MNCSVFSVIKYNYVDTHYAHMHSHSLYEMNVYISGSGYTVIGNKRHDFAEGSFAVIPPNVAHDEKFLSTGNVVCILFEADQLPFSCPEALISTDPQSPIFTYALMMFREAAIGDEYHSYINNHLLRILLTEIQRLLAKKEANGGCKSLDAIKRHINENFYKKLSFTELAAMSGYSCDYFRHSFKKQYGMSPQSYLINVRLENAYSILSSTPNKSITDVAVSCGFSDSSQFSVMFTRRFGISPKKFQKSSKST